jgi:bifunctional non-homologous end joining protein LigD
MTTHATTQSITLYYKAGSSDKVYQASLDPKRAGFIVNFAFGRRGSTMQAGTKTPSPVAYEVARKIYGKLVAEKTAKGYCLRAGLGPPQQRQAPVVESSH